MHAKMVESHVNVQENMVLEEAAPPSGNKWRDQGSATVPLALLFDFE